MSDNDDWQPQLPPAGFADGVMAVIAAEERQRRRRRIGAGVVGALAMAAAIAFFARPRHDHGWAIAKDRTEIAVGHRAKAVLEPGAEVTWDGDDVVQARGEVFYRVEPGARFVVHTPAGDIEVRGTCFSTKVKEMRDVKAGLVGAGISALAMVAVYEGKVTLAHGESRVTLAAGESGSVGAEGAIATAKGAAPKDEDAPLASANENLVGQVREYRTRLETVAQQKSSLEAKLKTAEERLAEKDGGKPVDAERNAMYAPTTDEWKELAKNGEVRFRHPCSLPEGWTVKKEGLDRLGLASEDASTIRGAFERSAKQVWSEVGPMCATALKVPLDVAQRIGTDACKGIILNKARQDDPESAAELQTQVAEIRAGLRAAPPPDRQPPLMKMFLLLTSEGASFEADLARSFGPEEAHRIALSDELCASNNHLGGGKKR